MVAPEETRSFSDSDFSEEHSDDAGVNTERLIKHGAKAGNFRTSLLGKLEQTKAWQPRQERPPAHQTVTIFDWDDTLLCTTYLDPSRDFWYTGNRRKNVQAVHTNLRKIATLGKDMLEQSLTLGKTFIVTNAMEGWVEDCIERHVPELWPLMGKVEVISARSKYEHLHPYDISMWKKEAFLEIKERFCMDPTILTNIIALGDAEYEMEAAKDLSKQFEEVFTKTVKFQPQPTADELLKQLDLVSKSFPKILNNAKNLKISLERRPAHK
eukprot:TRINITY_DN8067_c0_g1_i1.p1 TRINITY_DN8067_c0_g1~~TRINITY_DN8067_c0_g1_i1.p1  ORF type:complete len:268 (+),score=74.00 TRINITY_DN8067_c0_g1_i1:111-914(+)